MKDKFYFPKLKEAIDGKAWTQEEFKQKAYKINQSPGARSWSLSMKENNGITLSYANKAKKTLKELKFSAEVYTYEQCTNDSA